MKKYKNISYNCIYCSLILPILSFLLFAVFMNYAAPLNIASSENEETLSFNHENIQDEYNYEFYTHSDNDLASHSLTIENNSLHFITLNDNDDNYRINGELTNPASDGFSIDSYLDNIFRKYFIKQLTSQARIPIDKALRSDVLLI